MSKVETLIQEVQQAAKNRGHQLGLFNQKDHRTYVAECQYCFGIVIVTPNPSAEESEVMGMVVNTDCPASTNV